MFLTNAFGGGSVFKIKPVKTLSGCIPDYFMDDNSQ